LTAKTVESPALLPRRDQEPCRFGGEECKLREERTMTANEMVAATRERRFDFARLSGLAAASEVGRQMIVKTKEGREIRITVLRDMSTGRYRSAYERLIPLTSRGNDHPVWAKTPAYRLCATADLDDCLDAALREVSAVRIY
jgi:hypothetical protein